jgi:hypothetical protein
MPSRQDPGIDPAKFEEELAKVGAEDQARLQQYYAWQEQQNRERQHSRVAEMAKSRAKQEIKGLAGQAAKTALKRGSVWLAESAAGAVIAAFSGTIGTVLAIFAVIALFVVVLVSIAYQTCNNTTFTGLFGQGISKIATWVGYIPIDVCSILDPSTIALQDQTTVNEDTEPAPDGSDLVAIGDAVPVSEQASDPRLRECMLAHVKNIYSRSRARGVNFVITSAYRAGSIVVRTGLPSAHARGEAVDIAITPSDDWKTNEKFARQIDIVLSEARAEGFRPAQGDTLDEYRKPTEGASGGHIHVEFNRGPNGTSYCGRAV